MKVLAEFFFAVLAEVARTIETSKPPACLYNEYRDIVWGAMYSNQDPLEACHVHASRKSVPDAVDWIEFAYSDAFQLYRERGKWSYHERLTLFKRNRKLENELHWNPNSVQ